MTQVKDTTVGAKCKGAVRPAIKADHIHRTPIKGLTKEQWLEERRKSIGGSEMGAIMGTSPWSSAYSVYCERKGLFPAFEGNLATETGTFLEQFVAQKFSSISGLKVNRTQFIWRNDHHEHLHASPDRFVVDEHNHAIAGLECKTTSELNAKRVKDTDFPEIYYAQCVQYMMVTELTTWYLAVLVGNREFHIYMLSREQAVQKPEWVEGLVYVPQEDMDAVQAAADEFWQQLETNTPPDPDGSEATDKAIKAQYEDVNPGKADLWGQEMLLRQYMEARDKAAAADKEEKRLAQLIQQAMNGHEDGECLGYKVKWKMQAGKISFDYKSCVAANPDTRVYLKQGQPFRKFEVKKA